MKNIEVMKDKILRLLKSPDKDQQNLGLQLMDTHNVDMSEWFDALQDVYIWMHDKNGSKRELLDFFFLTKIDLSDSLLEYIPDEIGLLTNLTQLELERNLIKTIPNEIGNLVNLYLLDLSDNYITHIPIEIGLLQNLEELYIHNNFIKSIPKDIQTLPNLRILEYIND